MAKQMNLKILSQDERNLMQAVHKGDLKSASKLITEDRVDVNIQDVLMRAPLLRTCYLESRETRGALAKLLLKNGADVNMSDKHGRNPLMTACMETDGEDLVKILLKAKTIDPNARDEDGTTALMHAVRTDNVESVRTLLTWKPPPARKSEKLLVDLGDYEGMYPLLLAAKQQNPDICEILVRDGGAEYSEIPTHWKKYLPPECRGGKRKPITNDPFEKYRHQAQDILNTPFRPPMVLDVDPDSLAELEPLEQEPKQGEKEADPRAKSYPWMSVMAVTRYKNKNNKNPGATESAADIPVGEVVCITPASEERERPKSHEKEDNKKDEYPKSADEASENKQDPASKEKVAPKEEPKEDNKPKEEEKVKKDDLEKDPEKEQKPNDNPPPAEKPKPKPKPKGGWIDPPEEDDADEEPPAAGHPRSKSKKKKRKAPAYKTKGGRVIHPNARNDPQYKKIKEAKQAGGSSENGGGAKRPPANKSAGAGKPPNGASNRPQQRQGKR